MDEEVHRVFFCNTKLGEFNTSENAVCTPLIRERNFSANWSNNQVTLK
jgi:hypothetical protein